MTYIPEDPDCLSANCSDPDKITLVARALSSPKRVEILLLLGKNHIMSVNGISQAIDLPMSSTSMHIGVLEEAGLINSERLPGLRGALKMCSRPKDSVYFALKEPESPKVGKFSQSLPLGAFSAARDLAKPCGIASQTGPIGAYNNPRCFYLAERLNAQILWFSSGSLDYMFPMPPSQDIEIESLEFSFEVCTQFYINQDPRSANIHLLINQVDTGVGECIPEDQDRRGILNPSWWPNVATQHGQLQKWQITQNGTLLNGKQISSITVADLHLQSSPGIQVSICVPKEGDLPGGIDLFGENFGDYSQALNMTIDYRKHPEKETQV